MKRTLFIVALAALSGAALAADKSAGDLEKEKALASPYPNDLGPDKLDVSSYPKDKQEGYNLLVSRCAQCHSSSRPLNSRFVEPAGGDAAVAELKKKNPEMFAKGQYVWQVEGKIWNRYVKRMMSKPGCKITSSEGKKIWEFLVYDGEQRKLGAGAAKWKAHREKLLADFKAKDAARYKQLESEHDL